MEVETYQLSGQGNKKTEGREMWLLKGVWGSQNGKSRRRDSKILSVYIADSSLVHALLNSDSTTEKKSEERLELLPPNQNLSVSPAKIIAHGLPWWRSG